MNLKAILSMIDHHILDWTIIFLQYFLVLTFFRLHAHTKYSLLLRKFGSLIFRMNVVSKTQDNILLQFLNHNTFHNSLDFLKEIHKSKKMKKPGRSPFHRTIYSLNFIYNKICHILQPDNEGDASLYLRDNTLDMRSKILITYLF